MSNSEYILINAAGVNRVTKKRFNAKSALDMVPLTQWSQIIKRSAAVDRMIDALRRKERTITGLK